MEFLTKLFITHGAVQAIVALAATMAFGILLGRIKIFSVSFGIGGILFSGIILGHFGVSIDSQVLVFAREFGLVLFVFAIGLAVGPTFLESLRDQGLKMNLMSVYIVCCGAALAVCCFFVFQLTVPQTAGLFSGSVTNTPSLGSANEAWTQVAGSPQAVSEGLKTIGQAYAVCYPFGIFGIIFAMMLLKSMFHIDVDAEIAQANARSAERRAIPETPSGFARTTFTATSFKIAGARLDAILPPGVNAVNVERDGRDLAPQPSLRLRMEDRLTVEAADKKLLDETASKLGNNPANLSRPPMLAIFVGLFFGIFFGSIPVYVPGLPTALKLGIAGGTLLLGIFLGRMQRFCGMTFYMNQGANLFMREIGIQLFLACVGLHAGTGFVQTIVNGSGLSWMAMGAIITFVPIITAALFCRACWKINFPAICGMLSGCMTQPAALAFAMEYYGGQIPAQAYSTVYPLTMILRILAGQLLVLILAGWAG